MVQPDIWGPHGWKFIHYIALNFPNNPNLQIKQNYKNFFQNLQFVLPCEKCQIHYSSHIQKHKIDSFLHSRKSLFQWTVDIHNLVNQDLHKKTYTYDEALSIYSNPPQSSNTVYIILILFLLFLCLFFLFNL